MKLLNNTGIPTKYPGDGLSSVDVNAMNSVINSCVDASNYFLRSFCNINLEVGDLERQFNLSEAASVVPITRRTLGMSIKFYSNSGVYVDSMYVGTELSDSSWTDIENWKDLESPTIIDGGEW